MGRRSGIVIAAGVLLGLLLFPGTFRADDGSWVRQFGGPGDDQATVVALASDGTVYVAGTTSGTLSDATTSSAGGTFVRAYDAAGGHRWTRLYDVAGAIVALDVRTAETAGLYAVQTQDNALLVIRRFDLGGGILWTRRIDIGPHAEATAATVDARGNLYLAGWTHEGTESYELFLRKMSPAGDLLWTRLSESGVRFPVAIAADPTGVVYVVGAVGLQRTDAFVRAHAPDGTLRWERVVASAEPGSMFGPADRALGVALHPAGGAYVSGLAPGLLPGERAIGPNRCFVRRYDAGGSVLWTQRTPLCAHHLAVDDVGNLALAAAVPTDDGTRDVDVRVLGPDGGGLWQTRLVSASNALPGGITTAASGHLVVTGQTDGALAGQASMGSRDAFVAAMTWPVPAPAPSTPTTTTASSARRIYLPANGNGSR